MCGSRCVRSSFDSDLVIQLRAEILFAMDRYLCFVLMIVAFPFAMPQSTERGPCKCGVFPVGTSKSIIERSFQVNVTCDNEGLEQCVALCVALAKTAQDRMPQMICEAIEEHVENLQLPRLSTTVKSNLEDRIIVSPLPNIVQKMDIVHEKVYKLKAIGKNRLYIGQFRDSVAVFAETCDSLSWTFTGLKSEEPFLCCHDRKSISC